MVGEVFDEELAPVAGDERLHVEDGVESGDYAEEVREDVVEVGGVEVVLAVVGGVAGPGVDGRVVDLCGVWHAVLVVRFGVG